MSALGEGRWTVDSAESLARFRGATLWGLVGVEGEIPVRRGTVDVGADGADGEILLAASDLDTGLALRDGHLRSGRFLDAVGHPRIVFRPTAIEEREVRGTLTVRGATEEVTLAVAAEGEGDERTIRWETTLDRHTVGVSWNLLGIIPAEVALSGHARLVRHPGRVDPSPLR